MNIEEKLINDEMWYSLNVFVYASVSRFVLDHLKPPIRDLVEFTVRSNVGDYVDDIVWASVESSVKNTVDNAIKDYEY